AFKWSHLVFASATYNAGIFVTMEALISDLVAHNIQNRTVTLIENGSWAATSGGLIRAQLEKCKNIRFLDGIISLKSSLKEDQLKEIGAMTTAIVSSLPGSPKPALPGLSAVSQRADAAVDHAALNVVDRDAMFKLSYGLFVLTARDGAKDNGCIINTVTQITESPTRVAVAVSKANYTHEMIVRTGEFNVSILTEHAPFGVFEQFGFRSGKDADKFAGCGYDTRSANGIRYVPEHTNGVISAKVTQTLDYGTHTLFVADVTEALVLSKEPSATYQYYFDHIKPLPQAPKETQKGFVCKICGYVYEGDAMPEDYICPLCKHGVEDFEPLV
ncbi:MAG: flavin reductase, partial [Gracilibacteraceae bacterium]|nr:flavin reductase [Gracilibacteraceae bacterium]